MSHFQRIQDILATAELTESETTLDQLAFVVSRAHRAELLDGERLLGDLPRLKAHFDDCLAPDTSRLNQAMFLLSIADYIDDDDAHGRLCDRIRKHAQDSRRY